jgi:hypothetical protein
MKRSTPLGVLALSFFSYLEAGLQQILIEDG